MLKYDHVGIIVDKPQKGMIHYPEFKVWETDYEKSEYRIELLYFEKGSTMHPLIQTVSHICFIVDDIDHAVKGKKILLAPVVYENYRMAFIEQEGVPIEFLQYV